MRGVRGAELPIGTVALILCSRAGLRMNAVSWEACCAASRVLRSVAVCGVNSHVHALAGGPFWCARLFWIVIYILLNYSKRMNRPYIAYFMTHAPCRSHAHDRHDA